MFSEKSVGKHAFFLLIDRIKGKEGGIHYIIYISGRRGSWGWLDLWVLQVFVVRGLLQNLTKVPEKYSCLVPTVQHRYTNSIAMLHYQYSYAGLSV